MHGCPALRTLAVGYNARNIIFYTPTIDCVHIYILLCSDFPQIFFSSTDFVAGESDGTAEVCVTLSAALETALTVAVTSSASGSATGKSA